MPLLLGLLACTPDSPPSPPSANPTEHGATPHTHTSAHGGEVTALGDTHVEAVIGGDGVRFYLSDPNELALPLDGWGGNAAIQGPSGVVTVDLHAMGDHLHAMTPLELGKPASVVLTLQKDGVARSASFHTNAVGLAAHDHTALHGGVVAMWGEVHVEYVADNQGYHFFVTDTHRVPITTQVSGSVKDGDRVVPLQFDATSAQLSAPAGDAGRRPILLQAEVRGQPLELAFNPAP